MENKTGKCEQCGANNIELFYSHLNESWICEHCLDYLIENYLENFGY
jgi:ribosomal protein S27E